MTYPPHGPGAVVDGFTLEPHHQKLRKVERREKRVRKATLPTFEGATKRFRWEVRPLTKERISEIQKSSGIDLGLVRAIQKKGIDTISQARSIKRFHLRTDYEISVGSPTNQERTGRCWIFAALNMLRIDLHKTLGKGFEFSHSYVAFWDKFERCNQFLEAIIGMKDCSIDDRRLQHYLNGDIGDGGEWEFFVNIVEKYGLVPEFAMPETRLSQDTDRPNEIILLRLKEWAGIIHRFITSAEGTPEDYATLEAMKMTALREVYTVLVSCWGVPPTTFCLEAGVEQTPLEFYRASGIDLSEKVHICNLPQFPYNTFIELQGEENVVGGRNVRMLNVEMGDLKDSLRASIKDGKAVWLESSMAMLDVKKNLFSMEHYRIPEIFKFDTSYQLDKAQSLLYRAKRAEHAMSVIGCDDETSKRSKKGLGVMWKVENSWGKEQRFLFMTDPWFDVHCYGIVVDRKYLPKPIQVAMSETKDVYLLPLGSL